MGDKFEVWAYISVERGGYDYQQVWRGPSFVGALLAMLRAKRLGAGCVKLEWR